MTTTTTIDTLDGPLDLDLDNDTAALLLGGISGAFGFLTIYGRPPLSAQRTRHPLDVIVTTAGELRIIGTGDRGLGFHRLTVDQAEQLRQACIAVIGNGIWKIGFGGDPDLDVIRAATRLV